MCYRNININEQRQRSNEISKLMNINDLPDRRQYSLYLICTVTFVKRVSRGTKYQQHMQEHEATMTLRCTYCSYETEGRSKMTRHFGRMHNSRKQEAKYINYTAATTGHLRKREGERRDKWEEEKKTERESKERKEDKDDRKERKREGEDRKEKKKEEVEEKDRKKETDYF
ncbi:histone-lysine N-methyltransferase, H3 lysine-79 specific-like [Lytechinus pictus]|uniref:histone-lysine N-methyltransferase, H3 lysine-79 specific-like n=1 Tax=Lytechinus pictus TaxID=7653 RepID=UPI0030B9B7ED